MLIRFLTTAGSCDAIPKKRVIRIIEEYAIFPPVSIRFSEIFIEYRTANNCVKTNKNPK